LYFFKFKESEQLFGGPLYARYLSTLCAVKAHLVLFLYANLIL
jgi:hypothetical protein